MKVTKAQAQEARNLIQAVVAVAGAAQAASAPQAAPAANVPAAPQGPVLQAPAPAACRNGTARAAAYAALLANVGQPRAAVLAAVKDAETKWHTDNGRTPKGIAPAGWLRLFGATFA